MRAPKDWKEAEADAEDEGEGKNSEKTAAATLAGYIRFFSEARWKEEGRDRERGEEKDDLGAKEKLRVATSLGKDRLRGTLLIAWA